MFGNNLLHKQGILVFSCLHLGNFGTQNDRRPGCLVCAISCFFLFHLPKHQLTIGQSKSSLKIWCKCSVVRLFSFCKCFVIFSFTCILRIVLQVHKCCSFRDRSTNKNGNSRTIAFAAPSVWAPFVVCLNCRSSGKWKTCRKKDCLQKTFHPLWFPMLRNSSRRKARELSGKSEHDTNMLAFSSQSPEWKEVALCKTLFLFLMLRSAAYTGQNSIVIVSCEVDDLPVFEACNLIFTDCSLSVLCRTHQFKQCCKCASR